MKLFGDFGLTINGDELKGWTPDPEEGGVSKTYLSAEECREVARQFTAAAELLEANIEKAKGSAA